MTFKGGAEDALAGKAGVETNILYGHTGIFQQIFCGGNADIDNVFMRGKACFLFKGADKVIKA